MAFRDEQDEIMAEAGRICCNFPINGAAVALRGNDTTKEPNPSAVHSFAGRASRNSKRGQESAHVKGKRYE